MNSLTKKQLTTFDTPETLLVVSLYPKKGETYSSGTTGVASYTKNLVTSMNRPVVVLANVLDKSSVYTEKNTLVTRCFDPNQPQMWRQLFATIRQFKHTKHILIQFDFSMYGSMATSGLVLPFLALLKLKGYGVSVVSHHVVTNAHRLSGHLGLNTSLIGQLIASGYSFFFQLFYLLLGLTSKQVIVLEETLKKNISGLIPNRKVIAIPHAVDTSLKTPSKAIARKKLGFTKDEQVVIFFGFANWFKGADLFAQFFQKTSKLLGKKTRFIIAGGESVTLKEKPYYQQYFEHMLNTIYHSKAVSITGYVPQEAIKDYFAAADLVVFPYRYYMCASGVLSLVFSHAKPFIISNELAPMFKSNDIAAAFKTHDIKPSDIQFDLTKEDCLKVTKKVLRNGLKKKMNQVGKTIRSQRSFIRNAELYEAAIFNQNPDKIWITPSGVAAYDHQK